MATAMITPTLRPDGIDGERFELLELLGKGGMGSVYRALDRSRHAEVALKLLARVTPLGIHRFKREFRALADVSHPNLLTLYELLASGSTWYFTAELVPGGDFASYVRARLPPETAAAPSSASGPPSPPAPSSPPDSPTAARPAPSPGAAAVTAATRAARISTDGPKSLDPGSLPDAASTFLSTPVVHGDAVMALRAGLEQLAVGLDWLHRAGHLHRDIKPSNVLVTASGRVVLVDLGVALSLSADDAFESFVVGTPEYMAPEQARGGRLDERCDWYSVGVMLYELLTGRRPFLGHGEALLMARAHGVPRPVLDLSPGAPEDLAELTDALLALDPASRPRGTEVLSRLGVTPRGDLVGPRAGAPLRSDARWIVGREPELTALRRLHAIADSTSSSRVVLVRGSSGMGKTALCEAFVAEAKADGAVVLAGRCRERESTPFKAVDALFESLVLRIPELPAAERAELAPALAVLATSFPILRRLDDTADSDQALAPLDPVSRKRLVAPALAELLVGMAGDRPLMLFVDDVHWGDGDSAMLLAEALRVPWPGALTLVLSCRTGEEHSEFLRLLERSIAIDETIDVGPLPPSAAERLARKLVEDGGARVGTAAGLAERLAVAAGGVPYFLAELVQSEHDDRGRSPSDLARRAPVPAGERAALDALLRERSAALPDSARSLLEVVATAGRALDAQLACTAAGLPGLDQVAMVRLRNDRLVRVRRGARGELVESFHDRVREAITGALAPDRLVAVHAALAAAFMAEAGDPEAIAAHLEGAGEPARAYPFAVRAAEQAAASLAFVQAAAWYERALGLVQAAGGDRGALLAARGQALAHAGHGRQAALVLKQAAALDRGVAADRLELAAADQLLRSGFINEGQELLWSLLARLGEKPRRFDLVGVVALLWHRLLVQLHGFRIDPKPAETIRPERLFHLDALYVAASCLGAQHPLQGTDFCSRYAYEGLRTGEPVHAARAVASEAFAYSVDDGRLSSAAWRQRLRVGRELADRAGDPLGKAMVLAADAMGHYMRADLSPIPELVLRSVALLDTHRAGTAWERQLIESIVAWSYLYLGRLRDLASCAERMGRDARERGDLTAQVVFDSGAPVVRWLIDDQPELADAAHERLRPHLHSLRDTITQAHWHMAMSQALTALYRGEGDLALAAIDGVTPLLRRSELLFVPAIRVELPYVTLCGLLASRTAASDLGARDRRIRREIKRLRRDRHPLARPLATVASAALAEQRGQLALARRGHAEALQSFDALHYNTHAAALRLRLAELVDGPEAESLRADGMALFARERVRRPDLLVRCFVPSGRAGSAPHALPAPTASP